MKTLSTFATVMAIAIAGTLHAASALSFHSPDDDPGFECWLLVDPPRSCPLHPAPWKPWPTVPLPWLNPVAADGSSEKVLAPVKGTSAQVLHVRIRDFPDCICVSPFGCPCGPREPRPIDV
jgi:hypothetical protein